MQQRFVPGALVVGALGNLRGQLLDLPLESDQFGEGRFRFGIQRRRVGHFHLLRQVAYRALAVARHGARGGRLLADQHLQHRRLAGSVLADESDAVLGVDQKRNVPEQVPASEADRQVVYRNHPLGR